MQLKLAKVVFFLMLIAIEMKFIFDETGRESNWCVYLFRHSGTYPVVIKKIPTLCRDLERKTRLELATPTLARSCSTN